MTEHFLLSISLQNAFFSLEKVLHAKNFQALGVSLFTIRSVKHFSNRKVVQAKNHDAQNGFL